MTPTGNTPDQTGKLTKNQRQSAAREKAERLRLEAERRSRRQKGILIGATVAVILALVVGVGIAVQSARSQLSDEAAGPPGLTDAGGFVVGQEEAPVTVSTYVDFQCPACKAFETENASLLNELVDKGEIKVEYVPVSILDRFSSGTKYSTRSASAAYCVAENDPDSFVPFVAALFENQPEENGTGLPDEQLAQIAELVDATNSSECIDGNTYEGFVANVTDKASQAGLQGTPTVRIDGTFIDDLSKQGLVDQINAAKDKAGQSG